MKFGTHTKFTNGIFFQKFHDVNSRTPPFFPILEFRDKFTVFFSFQLM